MGFPQPLIDRFLVFPVGVDFFVLHALFAQETCKVKEPFFLVHIVNLEDREKAFEPAGVRPRENRILFDVCLEVFQGLVNHFGNAFVAGAVVVEHENLVDEVECPHIVGRTFFDGAGAEPAVFALTGKNRVDVLLRAGDLVLVVEEVCERNEPVEPVGNAFPAFAVSADPAAFADVRPNLVKVAGQTVCLHFELLAEPSGGFQLSGVEKFVLLHY